MKLRMFQVDAFTAERFRGNPAAVIPLQTWLPDALMQAIAAENNLSETAFFVREADPAPLSDMQAIMRIVAKAGYEQVMGDIQATLNWAATQAFADTDRVGITGYCWGGKVVWQAAARFDAIKAGVAWYGRLAPAADASPAQVEAGRPWPIDLAKDLKAPVLGLYGSEDGGIPNDTVHAMNGALKAAGQTDSQIILYDGAPHGFHADYRASYREADARDGWARLLDHFQAHLR